MVYRDLHPHVEINPVFVTKANGLQKLGIITALVKQEEYFAFKIILSYDHRFQVSKQNDDHANSKMNTIFKNPNHNFATILNKEMFVKNKILTYCT